MLVVEGVGSGAARTPTCSTAAGVGRGAVRRTAGAGLARDGEACAPHWERGPGGGRDVRARADPGARRRRGRRPAVRSSGRWSSAGRRPRSRRAGRPRAPRWGSRRRRRGRRRRTRLRRRLQRVAQQRAGQPAAAVVRRRADLGDVGLAAPVASATAVVLAGQDVAAIAPARRGRRGSAAGRRTGCPGDPLAPHLSRPTAVKPGWSSKARLCASRSWLGGRSPPRSRARSPPAARPRAGRQVLRSASITNW